MPLRRFGACAGLVAHRGGSGSGSRRPCPPSRPPDPPGARSSARTRAGTRPPRQAACARGRATSLSTKTGARAGQCQNARRYTSSATGRLRRGRATSLSAKTGARAGQCQNARRYTSAATGRLRAQPRRASAQMLYALHGLVPAGVCACCLADGSSSQAGRPYACGCATLTCGAGRACSGRICLAGVQGRVQQGCCHKY